MGEDEEDVPARPPSSTPRTEMERLMDALKTVEGRLDKMTETCHDLNRKIKQLSQSAALKSDKSSQSCWELVVSFMNMSGGAERVEPEAPAGGAGSAAQASQDYARVQTAGAGEIHDGSRRGGGGGGGGGQAQAQPRRVAAATAASASSP